MTRTQMKIYIEGVENKHFLEDVKKGDPDFREPSDAWNENVKLCFAMMYQGWLIGARCFDHKRYE